VHRKGDKGLVLKLDYEKAYNKVKLEFLYEVLELRGFNPIFICFIKKITQGGSVGEKLNNFEGDLFLTGKRLRHGDPIAPLLYNCIVDVFSRMLVKEVKEIKLVGFALLSFWGGGQSTVR
jgi:mannosylglycoprotein endo-beta-mannosidase